MLNEDRSLKAISIVTDKSKPGTKKRLPRIDDKLGTGMTDKYALEKMVDRSALKDSTNQKKSDSSKNEGNNSSTMKDDSKNVEGEGGSIHTEHASQNNESLKLKKKKDFASPLIVGFSNIVKRTSLKGSKLNGKRSTMKAKTVYIQPEKLTEVENIRLKLTEEYTKLSIKNYFKGKKEIISKWRTVMELLQNVDARLFLKAMLCLADIHVEFDEYEIAKHLYFSYKFFANYMELPEEVMAAYEALGNVYKFLFQYHKAIKCYKKQIEIAWILNDKVSELRAYDNIGIQYFYLGNKDKAKYYHERMLYGRSENNKTEARTKVSENYRNKNFHLFNGEKYVKVNRTNEMLKEKLRESLALFEDDKVVDLETVDILKNQDNMKNSFISEIDMTFSVIPEKYLDSNYLPELSSKKLSYGNTNTRSKIKIRKMDLEAALRENNNIVDNMILSHLSTKRKEFNSDRFKKIFDKFDKMFEEVKSAYKVYC